MAHGSPISLGTAGIKLVLGRLAGLVIATTGVYVSVVAGIVLFLGDFDPAGPLSLLATGSVAAVVGPLSKRIEATTDRLLRLDRTDSNRVLLEYTAQIRGSYADTHVIDEVADALANATGAEVSVWLLKRGMFHLVSTSPASNASSSPPLSRLDVMHGAGADISVPVTHQREVIGLLSFKLSTGASISPGERTLIEDFATHAGMVLRNLNLTNELALKVEELREEEGKLRKARRTLVEMHDAERRKVERDIHDGSQQPLIALTLQLRLAQRLVARDKKRALDSLKECQKLCHGAGRTLLELVRGLHSEDLRTHGLGPAILEQVRDIHIPVQLEDATDRRYPPEIESALYFAALEAIQNAAKHSGAGQINIEIRKQERGIAVVVSDDGRGFDSEREPLGSGLEGIAHRLTSLSGVLDISSEPGLGTTVVSWVPVGEQVTS